MTATTKTTSAIRSVSSSGEAAEYMQGRGSDAAPVARDRATAREAERPGVP
jgi:hypothetical protein